MIKGKDVLWACMDFEKAYDRVDREVLHIYGIGGRLLRRVKSFHMSSRACVRVGNSTSEWFNVKVVAPRLCFVTMVVQCVDRWGGTGDSYNSDG